MHHLLDLPYLDTRAEDLRWSVELAPLPALTVAEPADLPVQLRILGASHQVVLALPGSPALTETVAYLPQVATPLPTPVVRIEPATHPVSYEMRTRVRTLDESGLRREVDALLDALSGEPAAVSAVFPGHRHAATALHARRTGDGVEWRTWHAYPQHGQLVQTHTRVRRAGAVRTEETR
ncbi:DUF2617 family protein [Luteipulveratus sp. YIM 133132]|uniref:DUF2617 family protein n=1 Tax=Luteipulveratus flavus TaxID=3031728 RepID=A0ABT6CBB9_9MICO|nr:MULTISPECIES: DUF2617 family protein [unclassified Luteipulveratus]MDE9366255.1 DUF2617 family protein [Luteipulveratus sp. YIM 133132]MDF8265344.1 DUF2617 family protein [Luteipulveratus sp. YIM 133296]